MTSESDRPGRSDEELFAVLHLLARPLLEAGWAVYTTGTDWDGQLGDSVFYLLERAGVRIDLEYYDLGDLVAWPLDTDDPDAESLFWLVETNAEECRRAFENEGWLP